MRRPFRHERLFRLLTTRDLDAEAVRRFAGIDGAAVFADLLNFAQGSTLPPARTGNALLALGALAGDAEPDQARRLADWLLVRLSDPGSGDGAAQTRRAAAELLATSDGLDERRRSRLARLLR